MTAAKKNEEKIVTADDVEYGSSIQEGPQTLDGKSV